jgi:hypothetical protein
LGEI